MTRDVCVAPQTVPKRKKKGRLVSLWQSQLCVDVIQSGIFAHRTACFPLDRNATVPFAIQWYTVNVEKTSGRHLALTFGKLSRQHNGTHRFQMCRCSAKQWGPFSVYPVFETYTGIKQISAAPAWRESWFQISRLLRLTWLWIYYR